MMRHLALKIILVIALLLGGGFVWFVNHVSAEPPLATPPVDGFVVFTGSAGRVPFGLFQVVKGFDGPLLITGVHPDAKLADLTGADGLAQTDISRIVLDYTAQTTRDNVVVTNQWATANGLRTIGLITAPFHMPRSLLLFQQSGTTLTIHPTPSQPKPASFPMLMREYIKLLGAYLYII